MGLGAAELVADDAAAGVELLAETVGTGALETAEGADADDVAEADVDGRGRGVLLVHAAVTSSAATRADTATAGDRRWRMRPLSQAAGRSGRHPRRPSGDAFARVGYLAAMTDPGSYPPASSGPTAADGRPSAPGAPATNAPAGQPASKKRSFSIGQFLAAILFVLMVIFIVENTDNVKIRIIAGPKVNAPVFVALLIAAVAGALISELLRLRRKHKHR